MSTRAEVSLDLLCALMCLEVGALLVAFAWLVLVGVRITKAVRSTA